MTHFIGPRRRKASAALLVVLIFAIAAAQAQKKDAPVGVFQTDKGRFSVLLEGKSIGHEEFEIAPNGAGWFAR